MEFNKLIRDNVLDHCNPKYGKNPKYHIADDREYSLKLNEKLLEEVNEFLKSENISEISDILEVIDAIIEFKNFETGEIKRIKKEKREKSGGFTKRIILENSED